MSRFALAAACALVLYCFYASSCFAADLLPYRFSVGFWPVPLVPEWALVYLSINLMVFVVLARLQTWCALLPLAITLVGQVVVASCCFLLVPLDDCFPRLQASGWCAGVLGFAKDLAMHNNYFPSLHVTIAFTFAAVVGGAGMFCWAALIAVSTLFTHQHYVIDVLGGMLLAWAGYRFVYRPLSSEVERTCLREVALFSRRHVRYLLAALAVYRYSLFQWERTRAFRCTICLLQHVDDVLDLDRPLPPGPWGDPREYALAVLSGSAGPVEPLRPFVPSGEALEGVFACMIADWERASGRERWTGERLRQHHRATFVHFIDVMMACLQSPIRAAEYPGVVEALAWCSPMRDLDEDARRGLFNVPSDVEDVAAWKRDEFARASAALAECRRRLPLETRPGGEFLRGLAWAVERFARRYRCP